MMQTIEHNANFTVQASRVPFTLADLRGGYLYTWPLFALGLYLYFYGDCRVATVR